MADDTSLGVALLSLRGRGRWRGSTSTLLNLIVSNKTVRWFLLELGWLGYLVKELILQAVDVILYHG